MSLPVFVQLTRLSICQCGYSVLKEDIKLNTEYLIHPETKRPGQMVCGGCGKVIPITTVYAEKSNTGNAGILPLEIFL